MRATPVGLAIPNRFNEVTGDFPDSAVTVHQQGTDAHGLTSTRGRCKEIGDRFFLWNNCRQLSALSISLQLFLFPRES
jgi:hypothetical protein